MCEDENVDEDYPINLFLGELCCRFEFQICVWWSHYIFSGLRLGGGNRSHTFGQTRYQIGKIVRCAGDDNCDEMKMRMFLNRSVISGT